jgi:hypothetical protein
MNHSKGPWSYDEESGEVTTKDRAGYWGPSHYPVTVCTLETLDGIHNGPLIAAAPEMLDLLIDAADEICCLLEFVGESSARYMVGARESIISARKVENAIYALRGRLQDPVPAWQDDAYDATDRTAIHTDCASVQK